MSWLRTAALLGVALTAAVLPVFRLPRPDGPYAVGTRMVSGTPTLTQLWYPAPPGTRGRRAPYAPAQASLAPRLLGRTTQSIVDAPFAPGRFPVIVYIHGWGGRRWENTALLQHLASHGFVVAAADQPDFSAQGLALTAKLDTSSPAAWTASERLAAVKLVTQVGLLRALLDRLSALDAQGVAAGRLALSRIGVLGFSFGGATAAEAAYVDVRVRAVVNMDGLLFGSARRFGVGVPYLELSDDTKPVAAAAGASLGDRTLGDILVAADAASRANLAHNGGALLTIAGTLHSNFSDEPLLVPWRRFNAAGPIDPRVASRIIAAAVTGFFEDVLGGGPFPDLSKFSAVRLERWPRP